MDDLNPGANTRYEGMSLVEVLLALALISIAVMVLVRAFSFNFGSAQHIQDKGELEIIRRHVLNRISCVNTRAVSGFSCNGVIAILDSQNAILVSSDDSKKTQMGRWTLRGFCLNDVITVQAARLKPGKSLTDTAGDSFFNSSLTNAPQGWTQTSGAFFPTGTSPCEAKPGFLPLRSRLVIDTSRTYVVPPRVTELMIELWGGGGGGGSGKRYQSAVNPAASGAGGGGGGYVRGNLTVTPGQSFSVVVGAGGSTVGCMSSGNSVDGGDGGVGGDTIFGDKIARGGLGGFYKSEAAQLAMNGGVGGGFSAVGFFTMLGQMGFEAKTDDLPGGWGGASPRGGVGGRPEAGTTIVRRNGGVPGGGGAGGVQPPVGATCTTGGVGGSGRVIIWTP
jgi:hypothetical protein